VLSVESIARKLHHTQTHTERTTQRIVSDAQQGERYLRRTETLTTTACDRRCADALVLLLDEEAVVTS
jgi:hypothetical protein